MTADVAIINPGPQLPPRSDPLSEILHSVHFSGALYCVSHLGAPWGIEIPHLDDLMTLQIVTAGDYWIELDGGELLHAGPGSMTLVPHGTPHRIRSDPDAPTVGLFDLPVQRISDRFETVRHGGSGPRTSVTYGVLRFDPVAARRLLEVLPPMIHLDAQHIEQTAWLHSTLGLIAAEATALGPGAEIIISRLAEVLAIQTIRTWIEETADAQLTWLAAMRDEQIGRALTLVHERPGEAWTVGGLASEVGLSRSAFAARFTHLVGVPVMTYVADWRLQRARVRLQTTSDTVASVARLVGYESEATFGRAYKRSFGVPPGSDRSPMSREPLLPALGAR